MQKFIKLLILITLFLILNSQFLIHNSFAAATPSPIPLGPLEGLGPWQVIPQSVAEAGALFAKVASTILGTMTALGGLMLFLYLIIGSLSYITAGGDKANTEKARNQITNAFLGLIIIVAAWAIIGLIGNILGIDILNPQNILPKLNPLQQQTGGSGRPVPTGGQGRPIP